MFRMGAYIFERFTGAVMFVCAAIVFLVILQLVTSCRQDFWAHFQAGCATNGTVRASRSFTNGPGFSPNAQRCDDNDNTRSRDSCWSIAGGHTFAASGSA